MRTVPSMYIINLAISDMIYLPVHFVEACANRWSETLLYVKFLCKSLPFCYRLSVGLSAYSVAVLSIQRYRVTVNPFHVRLSSQPTRRAAVGTLGGVWIVAALFALPAALSKHFCAACYNVHCIIYYQRVILFEVLVSCIRPLFVTAFFYIMTARHLLKSARPIYEETQTPQLNTRKNTAKIVFGLTFFKTSCVPYHPFWACIIFNEHMDFDADMLVASKEYKLQFAYLALTCVLFINSCLNPVVLLCNSSAFRSQFELYLTCFCRTNSPPTDFQLTRRNRDCNHCPCVLQF